MPFDSKSWKLPKAEGLYNPALEKDACGVGFIVNIEGKSSRKVSYYFGCKTNFREIVFWAPTFYFSQVSQVSQVSQIHFLTKDTWEK